MDTLTTIFVLYSLERDRLRERERQARAAMSVQAGQTAAGGGSDTRHHLHHNHNHPHHNQPAHHSSKYTPNLFRGPVKVSQDDNFIYYSFAFSRGSDVFRFSLPLFPIQSGLVTFFFFFFSPEWSESSGRNNTTLRLGHFRFLKVPR